MPTYKDGIDRKIRSRLAWLLIFILSPLAGYSAPGIESRPANLTCDAPARPTSGGIALTEAFPDVTASNAMTVEFPPGNDTYLYYLTREGRVYRFLNNPSTSSRSLVLDARSIFAGTSQEGQSGMMDMAFHPNFANNGELYITYSVPGSNRTSYLARFTSSNGGASFSSNGEVLLSLGEQGIFHGIGSVFFGNEGYLYVGFGDSGKKALAQDMSLFNSVRQSVRVRRRSTGDLRLGP